MRYCIGLVFTFISTLVSGTEEQPLNQLAATIESKNAIKSVKTAEIDGVRVESIKGHILGKNLEPAKTTTQFVNVSLANSVSVSLAVESNEDNSYGVDIFQKSSGKPYVSVTDVNGDGVLDILTYDVLSVEGELLLTVEDYGMDGQADFKIDFKTGQTWVYWRNQWREAKGENSNKFILIDQQRLPLATVVETLRKKYEDLQ